MSFTETATNIQTKILAQVPGRTFPRRRQVISVKRSIVA